MVIQLIYNLDEMGLGSFYYAKFIINILIEYCQFKCLPLKFF